MTNDYAAARHNMIENQIRPNRVSDPRILDAFEQVPRERFVPYALKGIAYADEDLHLDDGRYLIEPMILARLLQDAQPDATDIALDIGCCTGYTTAILSRLVSTVVGVEQDQTMVDAGNQHLAELEFDNAAVIKGRLPDGYPKQQPYSLILIAGGVEHVPQALLDQLSDAGRLLTVLYDKGGRIGRAVSFEKIGGRTARRVVFDASTPLLPGFAKEPKFVF
jgi:protein-L-isoaspartate(D-aspartate) O-methyltransferase